MPGTAIAHGQVGVDLKPAPIRPEWITGGDPVARNAELARSRDGASYTLVWECTPGRFTWHYDVDETIHLLEGSVVLDDGVAPPRRLGPGDVVFFPAGAVVRWTVESRVRKLAFFRRPPPKPMAALARAARALGLSLKAGRRAPAPVAQRRDGGAPRRFPGVALTS